MYSLILAALIGGACGLKFADEDELFASFCAVVFLAGVGCGCGYAAARGLGSYVDRQPLTSEQDLVALRSSDGVSGSFVWGSGSISSSPVYNFMTREEGGTFSPRSVAADYLVHIKEDNQLHGKGKLITTYTVPNKRHFLANWSFPDEVEYSRYDFIVPKGTVVMDFSVK